MKDFLFLISVDDNFLSSLLTQRALIIGIFTLVVVALGDKVISIFEKTWNLVSEQIYDPTIDSVDLQAIGYIKAHFFSQSCAIPLEKVVSLFYFF